MARKITMLTAYDERTAGALSRTSLDFILVGDSVAVVKYKHPSTMYATMDMMADHVHQVRQGVDGKHIIGDMPYGSYDNAELALANARKLIDAGADSVKLEGGLEIAHTVEYLTENGINVMGHIGYTPQRGRRRVYGKSMQGIKALLMDTSALQNAGAYAIVLEMLSSDAAWVLTELSKVPTIGIGSGPSTTGQVLVIDDILGLTYLDSQGRRDLYRPRFVQEFLHGAFDPNDPENIKKAAENFIAAVNDGKYPMPWHYRQLCSSTVAIGSLRLVESLKAA